MATNIKLRNNDTISEIDSHNSRNTRPLRICCWLCCRTAAKAIKFTAAKNKRKENVKFSCREGINVSININKRNTPGWIARFALFWDEFFWLEEMTTRANSSKGLVKERLQFSSYISSTINLFHMINTNELSLKNI